MGNLDSRQQWVCKQLSKLPKRSRILDAGAGELQYKQYCKHLRYVSQDFAQYNGAGNGQGLQTKKWDYGKLDIVSDIIAIPEPDESFDAIMCTEVLEHVPHPDLALKEFARLLKPGGKLILTAPFASLTHFAPYHFSTGFSKYYYKTLLAELGFKINILKPNGTYFEYLIQEMYRLSSVSKQYARYSMPYGMRLFQSLVIRWLKWLAQKDVGSHELLCFGYHVLATKSHR